jgi:sugar phosphate isomerase/epimerase
MLLTVETHCETITADPLGAAELCRRIPGLGLTLDPSHYAIGPHCHADYDYLFQWVRHVRLRDTRREQFQVRIGQGEIEYGRIVNQLARARYNRALSVDIHDTPEPGFPVDVEARKLKYLLESMV